MLLGNIGTNSAQAKTSEAKILQHNYLVSKHTIHWFNTKGKWSLFWRHDKCAEIRSDGLATLCYKQRQILKAHIRRYLRLDKILHPPVIYSDGGYDWDSLVSKCEASGAGWYANTGNGFYFGPQFTKSTWHSSGGGPVYEMDGTGPHMRSYSIDYIKHIAYRTMQRQGPGAWPNCNGYLY